MTARPLTAAVLIGELHALGTRRPFAEPRASSWAVAAVEPPGCQPFDLGVGGLGFGLITTMRSVAIGGRGSLEVSEGLGVFALAARREVSRPIVDVCFAWSDERAAGGREDTTPEHGSWLGPAGIRFQARIETPRGRYRQARYTQDRGMLRAFILRRDRRHLSR